MITWNFINREKEDFDKTTLLSIMYFLNWCLEIENFSICTHIQCLLAWLSLSCQVKLILLGPFSWVEFHVKFQGINGTPLHKSFIMNEYYVSGFLHVEAIRADFNKLVPWIRIWCSIGIINSGMVQVRWTPWKILALAEI